MAEFCLECWNKINEREDKAQKFILSKELEICEGCGKWKKVIIVERKYFFLRILNFLYKNTEEDG